MRFLWSALVPAFFLVLAAYFTVPDHFFSFGDPDFGYLMNSLLLAEGRPVYHIDHPGTLLQWLGAGALWAVRLTTASGDLLGAISQYPNAVFFLTAWSSVLLLAASQFGAGLTLLRMGYSPWTVWLVQGAPLWFHDFSSRYLRLSPESLMAAAGLWVAVLFVRTFSGPRDRNNLLLFGAALGAACTTKANLWPVALLALTPLFQNAPEKKHDVKSIALAALASFALITIPAWPRFGDLFQWVSRLWLHSGSYGYGPTNVTSLEQLRLNLFFYWNEKGVLLHAAAIGLSLLVPLFFLARKNWIYVPVLLAVSASIFLHLKHPGLRYLVAFVPFLSIALLAVERLPWILRAAFALGAFALAFPAAGRNAQEIRRSYETDARIYRELRRELNETHAKCAVVVTTIHPSLEFALFSGNMAATPNVLGPGLERAFPRHSFWFPEMTGVRRFHTMLRYPDWRRTLNDFSCQVFVGEGGTQTWIENHFAGRFEKVAEFAKPFLTWVLYRHEGPLSFQPNLPENGYQRHATPHLPGAIPPPPSPASPAH